MFVLALFEFLQDRLGPPHPKTGLKKRRAHCHTGNHESYENHVIER